MLSTKIRPAIVTLVATVSFAFTLAAPAASQAQWHTIVVGGHVITHGNFTEGGVSPCVRIDEQLGKWQGAVGDDGEWVNRKGIGKVGKAIAEEELANAEGEVNRASGEAFEYGCDTVAAAMSSHGVTRHLSGHLGIVDASAR
ncbi:MAG TPA: hypothetical protein VHR65_03095 [Solirubrobacterales bacterium]|jgi:hypothetical protein|nr:hypothetical protein [Solirubrobacterales bacterium]